MEKNRRGLMKEATNMEIDGTEQLSADPVPFARSYQLEALEKAIKQNTIVFLETGSGKTLIAIMLLRSYAYLLRKPSSFLAIFLVPQVVLVSQQAAAVKMHTDLKVGMYWGDMGIDYWDAARWTEEQDKHEVLVMTPQILLSGLRHCFFELDMIKVLIFDECHHASGRHPYACIMTEFYHPLLRSNSSLLPRILGMTASPINSKGSRSTFVYWQKIRKLETLLNSKVYTSVSESVLAEFIPFSTPKLKIYKHMDIPYALYARIENALKSLKEKHEFSLKMLELKKSTNESACKKISKLLSNFSFCINELGVWLALKAAESSARGDTGIFLWGSLDLFGEKVIKDFSMDAAKVFSAYIPSGSKWSIGDEMKANMDRGFLTSKVLCLVESILEYRNLKDLRCIIFVQRVITSIVLKDLLSEVLPKLSGWKAEYIAGNNSGLQSQTRKRQNEIVEEFRKGVVNIIVATSILEEGLDVQSCNLVIRFDPSSTVCSFIQSRGRARMRNSDFLLMVRSGDSPTLSQVKNYLDCGEMMREESLRLASHPCEPLERELYDEQVFRVETTGAIVTLSSSVSLIYFYCSRLPSDGYFRPTPTCIIDKEMNICTLNLPKSCPIQTVHVEGNIKLLKQMACLEACKKLHEIGALTDNLVPDMVVEEAVLQEIGNGPYADDQPCYFPHELVNHCQNGSYHCYLIELKQNFDCDIKVHNIVLMVRSELDSNINDMEFSLEVSRGNLAVHVKYLRDAYLTPEEVLLCRRFQVTVLGVLMDHSWNKLEEIKEKFHTGFDLGVDYLLLPAINSDHVPFDVDWKSVSSVLISFENSLKDHINCFPPKGYSHVVETKSGPVCSCMLQNSLVFAPHTGHLYCIDGVLDELNGNSLLNLRDGKVVTYKNYYESRHGINLRFEREPLLKGTHIFHVQNYLQRCRQQKEKEPSHTFVELPPELCFIIMSPVSISTFYSFSFVPSVMYRIESLLLAGNLKQMCSGHCMQNVNIPINKVLEAITTKKCQEEFHLESLETLGDSFLKYATSQQLFKTYQNQHEGLLSVKKDKIISNASLTKLGCERKIPGFIRNDSFDPKMWIIPGDRSRNLILDEEQLSSTLKIYVKGGRKVKSKTVADVVEALIGAYLSSGGETSALLFMDWLGIKVDFVITPYDRHFQVRPEKLVNISQLECLLNYSFRDHTLLVEALTHGSYMLPEIPRCYQRLEFLGDAVLDYLITMHLYYKYPGLSPGLLTDLRSASVNNDCYAQSAVKAGLHKHILHASQDLHRHISQTVKEFEELSLESTFGWESESSFPKVLGDVVESLAGAILVDSGYNKEIVFNSIRSLLEPMITPETVRFHPVRELTELCQREHFILKKPVVSFNNGVASITIEVEANNKIHKHSCTASDKKMAKKVASREVLNSLKNTFPGLEPLKAS